MLEDVKTIKWGGQEYGLNEFERERESSLHIYISMYVWVYKGERYNHEGVQFAQSL